jgi:hypothetical protein
MGMTMLTKAVVSRLACQVAARDLMINRQKRPKG